jgi:two-component system sensor histidine kinase KdpD
LWRTRPAISSEEERLAKTFASQGALALERAALADAEDRARLLEDSDRFKSSLLSSVSHDLRTPLATIKAAASSLRSGEVSWDSPARGELLAAIDDETDHLNMLVGTADAAIDQRCVQRRWNVLRIVEVVAQCAGGRHGSVFPKSCLVPVDFVQRQVFTSLISNSVKFRPGHHGAGAAGTG